MRTGSTTKRALCSQRCLPKGDITRKMKLQSPATCTALIAVLFIPQPLAQTPGTADQSAHPAAVQNGSPQTNGRGAIGIRCKLQAAGRECVVNEITKTGPAERAGIQTKDIILPLDDADPVDVVKQIAKHPAGTKVRIPYQHGSERKQVALTVEDQFALSLRAAELGDPVGQTTLASIYATGGGVPEDYGQALKWYRKAADNGSADAQLSIGQMYFDGKGVPQDDRAAVSWYRKAAEQGNATGQAAVGWMYVEGRGVKKDPKTAVEWYRKAAEQGDAGSEAAIGDAYKRGYGVAQDNKLAVEWYQKAAENGEPYAQTELGVMYANGTGVPKNDATALNWFLKAAGQGFPTAEYELGFVYENGIGVPKDLNTAVTWYKKSAAHGYADAKARLEKLHR